MTNGVRRTALARAGSVAYIAAITSLPSRASATGDCFGAVAQLGERRNGIAEVRGSIPLGSTSLRP